MRPHVVAVALALMVAAASTASAQPPPPAAPAPSPRPRGVQVMTLDSPAWPDGGALPLAHSQAGRDVSPPCRGAAPPRAS